MKLKDLHNISETAGKSETMPVFFIGHGSPMNGIENNEFSQNWEKIGEELPAPAAVICISAHWLTNGTSITAMSNPRTIHDFGGFPKELYEVQYPAPGNSELAKETKELVKKTEVLLDYEWGIDHGTWSIIRHMFPKANIPVLQLSIDYYKPAQYHYDLAKELASFRNKGILVIGSGNMVHNLRMVVWDKMNEPGYGLDWALEINQMFKKYILEGNHDALINYERMGEASKLAIPTPDHYYPLLYAIGLQKSNEPATIFNDKAVGGSLTMTSVKIG